MYAFQLSIGGIDQRNLCIANNGFTGIGTSTPSTRLQVLTADASYGMTHTNGTVTVGTYIGNNGGWLGTQSNHPLYFFTNNSNALMALGTNGYVGIGSTTPTNKLQVGPATAFSGWDIAFGNGTQTTGLLQTTGISEWYSNTNIALMPLGNGQGNVGINTTTPRYPLEVNSYVVGIPGSNFNGSGYDYFKPNYANPYGSDLSSSECSGCIANISILASNNIMALEMDVNSDARIKDIGEVSDQINDLETLNKIQVTNYTLKDKVKNGNKPFKKVIAQQVETVYPQIVSRHVDFIPNVYRLTDKINKTDRGYILRFENGHHLSKDAKRIKLLASDDNTMKQYNIVSILSDKELLIDAPDLNGDKVFVYGEEVNDFRTVDYDGLTTLNISATQELSKKVDALEKENADLKQKTDEIEILKEELAEQKKMIVQLQKSQNTTKD